jgi:hypothetical protein
LTAQDATDAAVSLDQASLSAADAVLDQHMAALNAGDADALAATLHFPHYRLAGGRLQIWETPATYLADFRRRAGEGWARSEWDFKRPIAAGPDKVHFDVQFTRFRTDGAAMASFRSLWVVAYLGGRWAAQLRSTFAA